MELTSAAFKDGQRIPPKHTCEGGDASPALSWSGLPDKTRSLALVMDDPDAPAGTWVHWVLYDLPASAYALDEGLPKTETLASGAKQGLCWGVDSFDRVGYHGPCPPPGKPHRYSFRLYALDGALALPPRKTKAELLKALERRLLGTAELTGVYSR